MKSKIELLFEDAKLAGYHKPTLRTGKYRYSPAPNSGRNPGAVYIKDIGFGDYVGKIFDGVISLCVVVGQSDMERIYEAMNSPQQAAIKYGHQTGKCSICGRRLDNKISVALGIGPICNEKFGWTLPEGYSNDELSNNELCDLSTEDI